MTKRGNIRKFGRPRDQRAAFIRSLENSLISKGRITTTEARAKTIRTSVEKLITIAKKADSVLARRLLVKHVNTGSVKKLVTEIGPTFKDRKGGYTRIMHLPPRISDGARMVIIEFVS